MGVPFKASILLSAVLGLALAAPQDQNQDSPERRRCYWPNGEEMISDYTPCDAGLDENGHSACCAGDNDVCLENGLCYWKDPALFFRNGCTDRTWESPSCANRGLSLPEVCSTGAAGGGSRQMFYCLNTGRWCCGGLDDPSCCESSEGRFEMTRAAPAPSATSAELPSSASGSCARVTVTATRGPGSVSASADEPLSNRTCEIESCSGEVAKGAGIGVGATAGAAILLAAIAGLLMRRRKNGKASQGADSHYNGAQELGSSHVVELSGEQAK